MKDFELEIKNLISADSTAKSAFEKMLSRFADEDEKELSNHSEIIFTLYVKRDFNYIFQLEARFNVSESTLGRYRKKYLSWFDFYYKKLKKEQLVATTKDL